MADFDKIFHDVTQLKIAVIGDTMLDTYWWGKVDRISPEAPVPVVSVAKREQRLGGAGNVALNLAALGVEVDMIAVIGKDAEGDQLLELAGQLGIHSKYIVQSQERLTTNKIRIISRNQQMMRLDAEMTSDISTADTDKLLYAFENYIAAKSPQLVILEDYNKGVLTSVAIEKIIALCRKHNILVTVDPKRKNFFSYQNVDIFKPNLKEAKEALNIIDDEVSTTGLAHIHAALHEKLHHGISLITLSEKGVFYQSKDDAAIIPSHIRNIADVSGAGDTVISVASAIYAVTKDTALMAAVANIAGGLVCEEVGTAAISKEKLIDECKKILA